MTFRTLRILLASLAITTLAGTAVAGPAAPVTAPTTADSATEPSRALPVADYSVYVDLPTGFVFVKLPQGWKFSGQVDEAGRAALPTHVLTALLLPEDAPRLALNATATPLR